MRAFPEARHQKRLTSSKSPAARHQQLATNSASPGARHQQRAPPPPRHQQRVTSIASPAAHHQQRATSSNPLHPQRVTSSAWPARPPRVIRPQMVARRRQGRANGDLATPDRDLARGRAQLDSPHHRDMRCSTCAHNHRVCTLQWCSLQHTTGAVHPKTSPGRAFAWVHPGGRCLPQPGAQVARECANG